MKTKKSPKKIVFCILSVVLMVSMLLITVPSVAAEEDNCCHTGKCNTSYLYNTSGPTSSLCWQKEYRCSLSGMGQTCAPHSASSFVSQSHSSLVWAHSQYLHWQKCPNCTYETGTGNHTYNSSGVCVCGRKQ